MSEFVAFPKISRLFRDTIISEKIDGTNASIHIGDNGEVLVGSRNRFITPNSDNYGFARWVEDNKEGLIEELGPGVHYGEWWGAGIQRRYGLQEKRFSLFNTTRWKDKPLRLCHVVPELTVCTFSTDTVKETLRFLQKNGSQAAPGFMNPEGIVVYHNSSGQMFKVTLDNNDRGKWESNV